MAPLVGTHGKHFADTFGQQVHQVLDGFLAEVIRLSHLLRCFFHRCHLGCGACKRRISAMVKFSFLCKAVHVLLLIAVATISAQASAGTITSCAPSMGITCDPSVIYGPIQTGSPISGVPVTVPTLRGFNPFALIPTQNANGLYDYAFSTGGNRPVSISMPYFADARIQDVVSPSGWAFSINSALDTFGLGHSAGTITWTSTATADPFGIFSFESAYGSAEGSVSALMLDGTVSTAVMPIPLSPLAAAAGFVPSPVPVPEPTSLALLLIGLGGFTLAHRRISK